MRNATAPVRSDGVLVVVTCLATARVRGHYAGIDGTMKQITLILAALAAVTVESAPFRTIQRIWAVEPEKIEAAMAAYPGAFSDGIIIATFAGLKIGPAEVRDFTRQKAFVERMKAQGREVQICISSTIGHMDDWTMDNDVPKMVGSDGKVATAMACPRSGAFAGYLRGLCRRYAELGPTVVWIDDDFRIPHHPPVDFACFCDGCLSRFGEEYGVKMSRSELKTAILEDRRVEDGSHQNRRVRAAWRKYSQRAINDLSGLIADAVHAVDDKIIIGFMCCNPEGMAYAAFDFKEMIARAKNRDGVVWFRHGSGTYTDFTPYTEDNIVSKNIAIGRNCAMTEGPGIVNLTEEVTSPYNRRTKSLRITFLEAALNIGLAGADGVTYDAIKPNLDEQLRDDALVADIHRRRGELDRMRALIEGKRQLGVYPFYDPDIWLANGKAKSLWALKTLGAEDWKPLAYIGVPFTFREKSASVLLLSGQSARAMPTERLDAWRKRGVIADGAAAAEVGKCGRMFVFGKGAWSRSVWGRKESLQIKDALDRLAGGKMPSRVDTCVRLAQSVWESADGKERVVFLFNLDFDDATDVRLTQDGTFAAEMLNMDGTWKRLGRGGAFALPNIQAWTVAVIRLRR